MFSWEISSASSWMSCTFGRGRPMSFRITPMKDRLPYSRMSPGRNRTSEIVGDPVTLDFTSLARFW